jgi:RimJ/RimL family protein N-acetyltransferase
MSDVHWERPDIINLASTRVALGPVREDLTVVYNRWVNDFWMQRTWGSPIRPRTNEAMLERVRSWGHDEETIRFTIYRHDTWQPIGLVNLQHIDLEHRVAELGIGIGEPHLRNKGYGSETVRLTLFYAFRLLNLHAVTLSYDGANPGAPKAYANAGFKPAGRYRENVIVDNRRVDLFHMDCLAREFVDPEVVHWGFPGGE